jgi:hypothetical protein
MKIAVVTPYYQEDIGSIYRCYNSAVSIQHGVTHILVSDGHKVYSEINSWSRAQHMVLSANHADAGATPRALAAMSAFSQEFDAVAFLDADNFYEPDHIDAMVAAHQQQQVDVVAATRNICTTKGQFLYVDRIESTGIDFCDTNCMFLTRKTLPYLFNWIVDSKLRLWSDRLFWQSLRNNNLKIGYCIRPTVNYCSRWAWHYQQAGVEPPSNSVWIDQTGTGELVHRQHSNITITWD